MSSRFTTPFAQFLTNPFTGQPLIGGKLYFYASGGTTPLATYTDRALSVANTNPVILDTVGQPPNAIFLQNLAYNVVLKDSTDVTIWSADPVYTSDFSTIAQVTGYPGNPNGNVSGTAASGGISGVPASMVWDYTNSVLYVCSVTGNAASAVWVAANSASTGGTVIEPQGYLTASVDASGNPVISADQVGATTVTYAPYNGTLVPVYNGAAYVMTSFAGISTLALVGSHAADTLYDIFVFSNSGVLTLATGPAWTNSTAGTCARGSGAGTTQITRINGIYTNAVQITGRNGANTYTIAANQATYLGTLYTDHTAGQYTCHRGYGVNRKFGLWNAWNRVPIFLKAGSATASWTYSTNTWRASNNQPAAWSSAAFNVGSGTTCNGMTVLQGLQEEVYALAFTQTVNTTGAAGAVSEANTGIGVNSITAPSGKTGEMYANSSGGVTTVGAGDPKALYLTAPALGITTLASIEKVPNATNAPSFSGTEAGMVLEAIWRG